MDQSGGNRSGSGSLAEYDYLFKLIVIGDVGTGKSALLKQYLEKRFGGTGGHTVGVDFGTRIVDCGGKRIKLQIWDTAGQERFRSVTQSYCKGAMGALVIYDVTNRESYESVPRWIEFVRALAVPDLVVMIVGNKVDLVEPDGGDSSTDTAAVLASARQVSFLDSSVLAQEQRAMLLEASARTGASVDEIFAMVTKAVLSRRQDAGSEAMRTTVQLQKKGRFNREQCSC